MCIGVAVDLGWQSDVNEVVQRSIKMQEVRHRDNGRIEKRGEEDQSRVTSFRVTLAAFGSEVAGGERESNACLGLHTLTSEVQENGR